MAVTITITDAGRAAIVNAENTGTDPVTIAEIGLGDGSYTTAPDATATALKAEIKRLTTISGEIVADDTFHVTVKDEGNDVYDVTEFGLYLADGTLFAIYAVTSGNIMQKAAASSVLLAVDIILTTVNATSLTFGDTSFTNPPASTTVPGVTKYADNAQTQTGTADNLAVTPAGLSARTATETRTGLSAAATQAKTDTGTDDTTFVTPKKLAGKIKQATESVLGLLKVSTQAQTDAGTDDTTAVTPKKMRWGFSVSLTQNGYIIFPTWLSGLIIQWGNGSVSDKTTVSFPITFPNSVLNISVTEATHSTADSGGIVPIGYEADTYTNSSFKVRTPAATSSSWKAIGY